MKICSKCGAPIADFDKFCQECGTPAPVNVDPTQEERLYGKVPVQTAAPQADPAIGNKRSGQKEPKKPLSLKPSKSFVKGLICGLAIMAAVMALMSYTNTLTFNIAKTAYTQTEGTGYRSADEAVKAYAEAFAQKDYGKMLSTFAVESYVKNYDLASYVDRIKGYTPGVSISLPNDNSFVDAVLRQNRISELNRLISYEYMQVTGIYDKFGGVDNYLKPVTLENGGYKSGTDLVDSLFSGGRHFDELTIEAGAVLMPETLSELYSREQNLENLRKQTAVYKAEKVENRAVELTVNGEKYLLCMQCICYNGKWYNDTPMGNLAMLLGMNMYTGGLAPADALGS